MRLIMMGTGSFAVPTFEAILAGSHPIVGLVTQPDRVTGKERGSTRLARHGLKDVALERGVPFLQPESINTPEGVRALAAWKPDLLVVAAYGQILAKEVLAVAAKGGINVHASLLPKYRGAAPIAWAIANGETVTGVTIIRMSSALDAGDVLAQESLAIDPNETAGELELRLAPLGARLALAVIDQLAAGTARGIPQDMSKVTKAPKLTKERGKIDWSLPANKICDFIRAMQPWPTAYTFLHRPEIPPARLIICRAALVEQPPSLQSTLQPGLVAAGVGEGRFQVGTGDGRQVAVLELQPAGKRRMTAADFLRGHAIQTGWRLGGEVP